MITTCPNKDCPEYQKQLKVKGGCECGSTLVEWHNSAVPTVEQIAYIVCDVSLFEGKYVPRGTIEEILMLDDNILQQWIDRLKDIDWKRRLDEIHLASIAAEEMREENTV